MKKIKHIIFFIIGMISLVFGIVGIVVPLLPTTPFLLLASFGFIRSSKRLNDWLLNHKLFGNYLKNYIEEKAIGRKSRKVSLGMMWFTLSCAMYFSGKLMVTIILIIIGSIVTYHLMTLKVLED